MCVFLKLLILPGLDPKEKLLKQRHLLQKRLGLDVGGVLGMDSEELFDDEDLIMKKEQPAKADSNTLKLPVSCVKYCRASVPRGAGGT